MKKFAPVKIRLMDETVKTALLDLSATTTEAVDVLGEKLGLGNAEECELILRAHRPESGNSCASHFLHLPTLSAHMQVGIGPIHSTHIPCLHRYSLRTCEAPTGPPPAPLDQSRSLWENHVEQDAQLVLIVEN